MRATDATGHKIASAYGYATRHTKPQGFIIRPPLLTTYKYQIFFYIASVMRFLSPPATYADPRGLGTQLFSAINAYMIYDQVLSPCPRLVNLSSMPTSHVPPASVIEFVLLQLFDFRLQVMYFSSFPHLTSSLPTHVSHLSSPQFIAHISHTQLRLFSSFPPLV